jgi:hypothetical protein
VSFGRLVLYFCYSSASDALRDQEIGLADDYQAERSVWSDSTVNNVVVIGGELDLVRFCHIDNMCEIVSA